MPEMVLGYVAALDAPLLPSPTASNGGRIAVALAPGDVTKVGFHQRVTACCRRAAFLPARMGIAADHSLLTQWATREETLLAALSALGRRIELAVTATLAAPARFEGRSYLAALKTEQEELDGVAARLRSLASHHGGDCRFNRFRRGLEGSFLTTRADIVDVVHDLERFDEVFEGRLTIAASGPWPPYRFAAALLAEVT